MPREVDVAMKLAIADPPYLGRAVRWYGKNGCGTAYGKDQADQHPEAYLWDEPETHQNLVKTLQENYDGWAIAATVHSLSTYLQVISTDSRNGIRVCVWHKPSAVTSGSRITNHWEPVIVKIPKERKGWQSQKMRMSDVLTCNPPKVKFMGAKPREWTLWVLNLMGYTEGDVIDDLFVGSGAVTNTIKELNRG